MASGMLRRILFLRFLVFQVSQKSGVMYPRTRPPEDPKEGIAPHEAARKGADERDDTLHGEEHVGGARLALAGSEETLFELGVLGHAEARAQLPCNLEQPLLHVFLALDLPLIGAVALDDLEHTLGLRRRPENDRRSNQPNRREGHDGDANVKKHLHGLNLDPVDDLTNDKTAEAQKKDAATEDLVPGRVC